MLIHFTAFNTIIILKFEKVSHMTNPHDPANQLPRSKQRKLPVALVCAAVVLGPTGFGVVLGVLGGGVTLRLGRCISESSWELGGGATIQALVFHNHRPCLRGWLSTTQSQNCLVKII